VLLVAQTAGNAEIGRGSGRGRGCGTIAEAPRGLLHVFDERLPALRELFEIFDTSNGGCCLGRLLRLAGDDCLANQQRIIEMRLHDAIE
jgi:hypothetical protein